MSGAAASDVPPRRRVMAIGWDPTKRVALLNPLGVVVRAGGEAVLMVSGRGEWEPVHHRMKVIHLREQELRSGPNRLVGYRPPGCRPSGSWVAARGAGCRTIADRAHGRRRSSGYRATGGLRGWITD